MLTPRRPFLSTLSGSEAIATAAAGATSVVIVAAYLIDAAGFRLAPAPMALIGGAAGISLLGAAGWRASWNLVEVSTYSAIVTGTFAWLMWIARPSFLPLGGGDLAHHLALIQYIEQHWRLVHDVGLKPYLGEFTYYTPGSHLLTALVGAWSGTSGFRSVHAVMAAAVALKAGVVFLVAQRLLPGDVPRTPIAAIGALTLFTSQLFFLGSVLDYSFLAQVVCEWLAMVMWWVLSVWDEDPRPWAMAFVALIGMAVFLTWPILLGAPLVLLGALVILPRTVPLWTRARPAAIGVAPLVILAVQFTYGRARYLRIVGSRGSVAYPSLHTYAWWFLALSLGGIAIATIQAVASVTNPTIGLPALRRGRTLAVIVAALLIQAATFAVGTTWLGHEPYMAFKMFYFLLGAQAVGVAVAVGWLWRGATAAIGMSTVTGLVGLVAWVLVAATGFAVARPLAGAPQSLTVGHGPATSLTLWRAGRWASTHVPIGCVEYLVGNLDTAYWLHTTVLGNPRRSKPVDEGAGDSTDEPSTYEVTPALVQWPTRAGQPYAIADFDRLPAGVDHDFEILVQFGNAAVVRPRGPSSCRDP